MVSKGMFPVNIIASIDVGLSAPSVTLFVTWNGSRLMICCHFLDLPDLQYAVLSTYQCFSSF